ncbi:MAG: diguanylate cyclase, partial [Tepidisphaeraceae bacterium]
MSASTHPRLHSAVRLTPTVASIAVAVCAALVLVGWLANIEFFKSLLHPARTAMNPATAVCFLVCAAALWLLRREGDARRRAIARTLAAVVVLVGLSRSVGYFAGWTHGPDQLLFRQRLAGNVMAPNTAVTFVLVGVAMALFDDRLRGRAHPAQAFILAATTIALLALTGYIYRIIPLYGVAGYIPMALNTALGFLALSIGLICARPSRRPMTMLLDDSVGGVVARRLLPAAFLVPLALGWLRIIAENRGWVSSEFGFTLLILSIIVVFN